MQTEHITKEMQQTNNIVFYQTENADVVVNVVYKDETFWLSQKAMAALFDVNPQAITKHLSNIYEEQELVKDSTCSILEQVQREGKRNVKRSVEFYNLDAIIAVGYRVNSKKATKFRQWATKTLREYITKGFVLNEKLLKNGKQFGQDYFDELLEKIREIRASERRAYQKITDIFEQCSCDYDKDSETTKNFYAFVQNKLHFAVSGNTAAEIVYNRADSQKEHMGLTSWKNSPNGKIYKSDVTIAKNYLNEKEISRLNRLVTMFIDYAELQAEDGNLMKMQDCVDAVNMFLQSNRQKVLESKGKISHEQAIEKAHHEYEIFRVIQDREYISEFDRQTKRIEEDSK
ncbi:MAG: virulence RhuM family protein [Treponema sp.]|uniref:virulence RhuM family protein n=1 Tax=Treponema sp. TaxID=166 RepID=UPI00298DC912|nr:virulence RhuM family protein [Treponema sp.]MDD5810530.1 virulence RhuM family protein [Treponema sp.]